MTPGPTPSPLASPVLTLDPLIGALWTLLVVLLTAIVTAGIAFWRYRQERLWDRKLEAYTAILEALFDMRRLPDRTIAPTFRDSFRRRRCLVMTDGFYEWLTEGKVKRQYLIRLASREPFAFAGLWWPMLKEPSAPSPSPTCSIVTCPPNDVVAPIHDRMPVILGADARARWLDPASSAEQLLEVLRPYPAAELEAFEVSRAVSSPRNDGPDLIAPVEWGVSSPQVSGGSWRLGAAGTNRFTAITARIALILAGVYAQY